MNSEVRSSFQDPLTFNLEQQKGKLVAKFPSLEDSFRHTNDSQLLDILSQLLSRPETTICVSILFRPILFDLCARFLNREGGLEEELVAICLLIQVHEELYSILYQLFQKPQFLNGPLQNIPTDQVRVHRLLLAYFRILSANRELPNHLLWSPSPLYTLATSSEADTGTRLLAIRCYALQSGMGEADREKWERKLVGNDSEVDCPLDYGVNEAGAPVQVDGWLLPVLEYQRARDARIAMVTESQNFYDFEREEQRRSIDPSALSLFTANIYGVFLLRCAPPTQNSASNLIPTSTAISTLRSLALHISDHLPVLLTSPPSSGKSLLLSHLAETLFPQTHNQIISIQLADTSLDPRSLLGNYVSSVLHPGVFEWKEGVLVRAMKEGRWLILKDVDRASNEMLGLLKPFVESLEPGKWIGGRARIDVPGRGTVVAADSFALFATRSVQQGRGGAFQPPTFFGAHKFQEVILPPPSLEDLRSIIEHRFSRLVGSAGAAFIRMWEALRSVPSTSSTRDIGLKDLERYCTRVEKLLPPSHQPMDLDSDDDIPLASILPNHNTREDLFLAARDVFFGEGALTTAARSRLQTLARVVGMHLGLDEKTQDWLLHGWKPEDSEFLFEKDVNNNVTGVRMKRAWIQARPQTKVLASSLTSRPFALHRPARILLSRIVTAVSSNEPLLLTGETGTGKTTVITYLANRLNQPLVSLNLSNQTESSDLLGGFRPVEARVPGNRLFEKWLDLFGETFSRKKNESLEKGLRDAVVKGKWKQAVHWWKGSTQKAKEQILKKRGELAGDLTEELDSQNPRKRRKLDLTALNDSEEKWAAFEREVDDFNSLHVDGKGRFAFAFIEGPLVKALRAGDWVLLDEINLASPETLECISTILQSSTSSITLTEQGSLEPVPRHPNFRLFACMNPATDVGKKDLPPHIRTRFTEIDVPPPDADPDTLFSIVEQYIGPYAVTGGDKKTIRCVAEFYKSVKELAESRQIVDGANKRPHFSMRTLARALTFAGDVATTYGLKRALWEGCKMAFMMVLDFSSAQLVETLMKRELIPEVTKNAISEKAFFTKEPAPPTPSDGFVKFGHYYLERGPLPEEQMEGYIIQPSVARKLEDLSRIILTRRFPILIEGPTSAGKTSAIEYLARKTGHRFVRINNHDHTDIQEYIGSYVSDPFTGKLVFQDGLLVRALRNGDWIVLDELNLAPTDVMEALNRLLDDNRELVVPETGEVIKPHPHFMLFATQNPPGLYAGRKVLSRAFRNRFLEVHFQDVPEAELKTILEEKCLIAPSRAESIVAVFRELQRRRTVGRVFESKQSFATLRDLFRWGERLRQREIGSDVELAEDGYMLLAERARREEDRIVVKEVIESVILKGKPIDAQSLYDFDTINFSSYLGIPIPSSPSLVWTSAMKRLFVLVARALRFNEPVLLVGETGAGKTSVVQEFATTLGKHLHALNCHQNTETADMIGGMRPVRNRKAAEAEMLREVQEKLGVACESVTAAEGLIQEVLRSTDATIIQQATALQRKLARAQSIFEWRDGPLVDAMKNGDVFLLDEISLADDSVLERLNSVLEPSRTIVLAEKGGNVDSVVQADPSFKLVATMNPGGDYGKKELSPALRNRFTEIWVPAVDSRQDLEMIVGRTWGYDDLHKYTTTVLDYVGWLSETTGDHSFMNLRDILAWVSFTNTIYGQPNDTRLPADEIFHHAAHMTFLDGLASVPSLNSYSPTSLQDLKTAAQEKLTILVPFDPLQAFVPSYSSAFFQLGSFAIPRGPTRSTSQKFNFQAPTSRDNAMRVVRACQLGKPILLEGSPGVGKTSLVTALADMAGHHLCRINLSDQTDLIDLFGSDLPVEGGRAGEFAWKDGEFLRALQDGHWVLLDEMNLAPQAVLEGLNAVLDHRGTVYIPELGRSFIKHPSFRIFAAQNPLSQGGGRKGLPKSFMNRFTKVYVDQLSPADLVLVCRHYFPMIAETTLQAMVTFNSTLNDAVTVHKKFAREGAPWEFNLRDVLRWCSLVQASKPHRQPVEYLRPAYLHRLRNSSDRRQVQALFDHIFGSSEIATINPSWSMSSDEIQVGVFQSRRNNRTPGLVPRRILQWQLSALEALGCCLAQSWLAILTGPCQSGKTSLVRTFAHFTGHDLYEIAINSSTDTMDILGGFEQTDPPTRFISITRETISMAGNLLRSPEAANSQPIDEYMLLQREMAQPSPRFDTIRLMTEKLLTWTAQFLPVESQHLRNRALECVSSTEEVGRFEWVDGPLVEAIKEGHWVLLDSANLCNPSVLDRLNSLCEDNGFLTLSERGFVNGKVEILRPSPGFRLFMSVDPQYGELSRAMRNRGIEISLIPEPSSQDIAVIQDYLRLPSTLHKSLIHQFSGLRRATVSQDGAGTSTYISSSGRALDTFSSLSPLLDQAPVISESLGLEANWTALRSYLSRTVSPASLPSYTRFFSTPNTPAGLKSALLEDLPRVESVLSPFRREYGDFFGSSPSHVAAQPLDPYLFLPANTIGDLAMVHQHVLGSMEVLLAASADLKVLDRTKSIDQQERGVAHRATLAIDSLMMEIASTSRVVLESSLSSVSKFPLSNLPTPSTPSEDALITRRATSIRDLSAAGLLLKYAHYLRLIVARPVFDFSSVQAIAKWILDSVEDFTTSQESLMNGARTLKEITSLSSGLGLAEIWRSFLTLTLRQPPEIKKLEKLGASATCTSELRGQILNLLSVTPLVKESSNQVLNEHFLQKLEHRLVGNEPSRTNIVPHILPTITLLGLLVSPDLTPSLKSTIEQLLGVVRQHPTLSLHDVVPFQHFLWLHDYGQDSSTLRRQMQLSWMKQLWIQETSPAELFSATNLRSILSLFDWSRIHLSELVEYDSALKTCTQLSLVSCERYISRTQQISALLQDSVNELASWFVDAGETLKPGCHALLSDFPAKFSKHSGFVSAIDTHLYGAVQRVMLLGQSRTDLVYNTGICWVAISRVILDLFVPDIPIDPITVQNCSQDYWNLEQSRYSSEIHLHLRLEHIVTGNKDNQTITCLRKALDQASRNLGEHPSSLPSREVSRLHKFWAEILQFQKQVLVHSRIDDLIMLFESNDHLAQQQEEALQRTISGFLQRIESVYKDFDDMVLPLQHALLALQLGLRMIQQARVKFESERIGDILSMFPSVRGSQTVLSDLEEIHGIAPFQRILLSVASIGLQTSAGISITTNLSSLQVIYEQAFGLWNIDQSEEKEKEKMSQSLYRNGTLTHQALSDAEVEQAEFLELFPSFESILSDEQQSVAATVSTPSRVSDADARKFVRLYMSMCNSESTNEDPSAWDMYDQTRTEMLSTILSSPNGLTENVDHTGLFLQLRLLDQRSRSLHDVTPDKHPYNFYVHANVHETRKAVQVVTNLRRRLHSIIEEFPDQMVLQHLEERCAAFLALDLHSPIAKILTAIEQLLLQTEDWEMYANRDNTLKPNRAAIIELIVEWRRLELSSWRALLAKEVQESDGAVAVWWFRLYDLLVRGSLDAWTRSREEGTHLVSVYLDSLPALLDDYIRGSPVGQFHARMRLLSSFEVHCERTLPTVDRERPLFESLQRIIHATVEHFNIFAEALTSYVSSQQVALESEILDLIKLASWKDINVHALRQSAQRTHHQLYKIVRRFREVLRQPVANRLSPSPPGVTEGQALPIHLPPVEPSPVSNDTYARFVHIIQTRIRPVIGSKAGVLVDDLATEIITISKELATVTVPASVPAEKREKHLKALLNRKRKAWSDLLKGLKSAGLSSHVKSEVLLQNASTRWVREQPITVGSSASITKGESYLHRLNGSFPDLRSALSNHHADIGTRELQKGVMFLEYAFSMAIESRASLSRLSSAFLNLERSVSRLVAANASSSIVSAGSDLPDLLRHLSDVVAKTVSTLCEVVLEVETYGRCNPTQPVSPDVSRLCSELLAKGADIQNRATHVLGQVNSSSYPILLAEEYVVVQDAAAFVNEVVKSFECLSQTEPRITYLLVPAAEWLATLPLIDLPSLPKDQSFSPNSIINACLITAQGFLPKCPESASQEDDRDNFIKAGYRDVRSFTDLLNVEPMLRLIDDLLRGIAAESSYHDDLQRILPYLKTYTELAQTQFEAHSHFNAAFFKLNFVLCSILQTLSKQGFCKPPEESSDENGSTEGAEMTDGVGMGEGSGAQNVSKEIEEESQVEGLKGEQAEDGKGPENTGNDAIEMDQDFDGEMQDVPEDEDEERQNHEDDRSEDGSEADPEEQIGDVDISDPAAVDEKLWGDEKGPQDSDNVEQKTNEDHSTTQGAESEMVAKEDGQPESKEKPDHPEDDPISEDQQQVDGQEQEETQDEEDSEAPGVSGMPMDEHVPEGDTLDLPDDLDMNTGEQGEDTSEEMDLGEDAMEPTLEPETEADGVESKDGMDQNQENPDNSGGRDEPDPPVGVETESTEETPEEEHENTAVAQPDVSAGDGNPNGEVMNPDVGSGTQGGLTGTSTGVAEKDSQTVEAEAKPEDGNGSHDSGPTDQVEEQRADASQPSGTETVGMQQGPQQSQQNSQLSNNPLRSLGDALKEVQQRFDEILDGGDRDIPHEKLGDVGESSQLEYLRPDDTEQDMQALGPSEEEQASKLNELRITENNDEKDTSAPMDVDVEMDDVDAHLHQHQTKEQSNVDQNETTLRDVEDAIVHDPYSTQSHKGTTLENVTTLTADVDMDEDVGTESPAVEAELRSWQSDGLPDNRAEHIWRLYESLTHDLAYALCEQLRLILEPTLATRLRGDYRTGKRLNMKKIIPYIASDYTKDKIWLRRTRPSQREYQVLIALDDSKSMAESHSVHLAYQTLALISKALSRLEAGDVGITRFGKTVDVLHGFEGAPFTDQAGVEVMKAFRFDQKATDILALVETSLRVLESARERKAMSSSTAADLWQLQVIISDGVCQDHEKLHPLLRKAEEQKVMIVFVIIDSLHASPTSKPGSTSILSMNQVKMDPTGKMDLIRYMDTFPFEYHIVLRNVEALPEVLSTTLKQFFERVSEE